jgi:rhodanese-related sulfurtransferase
VTLYFAARDEMEPVPAAGLLERAKKGLVTALDVRPPEEFAAGHVPGAVNIPVHQLARRLAELPKRKQVVACCLGPFCLRPDDAVQLLRSRALKARRAAAMAPGGAADRARLTARQAQRIGASSRRRGTICFRSDRGGELLPPKPVRHCRQRFAAACPSSSRQRLLLWHYRRWQGAVLRVPCGRRST